jgi:energy-coupling factor transporter ATP-binding protein EcfA2
MQSPNELETRIEESERVEGQSRRYAVEDSSIAAKAGSYLITVGNPSAGKSTLQNALVYRLWSDQRINFEYSSLDDDHEHDAILNSWVTSFASGELPRRSEQGILQEYNIRFGQASKQPLTLNFLEISGEDIKSIVPKVGASQPPRLNPQLERYLRNEQINKRFLFLSDASLNRKTNEDSGMYREDMLFNTLIQHLLSDKAIGLKRINVLFVATKWDMVQAEYSSIVEYFNKNFPQTRALVSSTDRIIAQYIPFSIGEIQVDTSGNPKVMSLQSRYIDLVIQWIYSSYIGTDLKGYPRMKLNLWDKVKSFFG